MVDVIFINATFKVAYFTGIKGILNILESLLLE